MTGRRSHRRRDPPWLILAAAALSAPCAVATAAPQTIGVASAVVNDVRIDSVGTTQFRPAVVRERVALADQVLTGGRSQLQILLLDRSMFTIGAHARLTIDRYVYDPGAGRSLGASVATGAFRFMSNRPDSGSGSTIETPVAVIGVRGTIVDGVVGPAAADIAGGESGVGPNVRSDRREASLIVLRGPGRTAGGAMVPGEIQVTAGGRTIGLDRPMLAAYVPFAGATPIGPFQISVSGLARVQSQIFPGLAAARGLGAAAFSQAPSSAPPPPDETEGPPPDDQPPPSYPPAYPPNYPPSGPGYSRPYVPPAYPYPRGGQQPFPPRTSRGQGTVGAPGGPPSFNVPPRSSQTGPSSPPAYPPRNPTGPGGSDVTGGPPTRGNSPPTQQGNPLGVAGVPGSANAAAAGAPSGKNPSGKNQSGKNQSGKPTSGKPPPRGRPPPRPRTNGIPFVP